MEKHDSRYLGWSRSIDFQEKVDTVATHTGIIVIIDSYRECDFTTAIR